MQHVVKSFVYLEDRDKYAEMNKNYGEFFTEDPPARTTLGVAQVPGPSRLEITCIAYSDLAGRKADRQRPARASRYSPGILAGDTLYVSGKGDQLPDGGHPATFEEQVRQAMKNVETTLKQAGLDFRHVVMSHVFLDKYENLEVGQPGLQRVLRGRQRARLRHGVRRLDPGRLARRGHLHRHDRPVGRKVVRPAGMKDGPIARLRHGAVRPSGRGTPCTSPDCPASKLEEGAVAGNLADQVHQMARNHIAVLEAAGLTSRTSSRAASISGT